MQVLSGPWKTFFSRPESRARIGLIPALTDARGSGEAQPRSSGPGENRPRHSAMRLGP